MNNMNVAAQQIKVEMAKTAREATPQGASNPYMALQMQQLHQYQLSALQSQSLAAQVANLRMLQKNNPSAVQAPGAISSFLSAFLSWHTTQDTHKGILHLSLGPVAQDGSHSLICIHLLYGEGLACFRRCWTIIAQKVICFRKL